MRPLKKESTIRALSFKHEKITKIGLFGLDWQFYLDTLVTSLIIMMCFEAWTIGAGGFLGEC